MDETKETLIEHHDLSNSSIALGSSPARNRSSNILTSISDLSLTKYIDNEFSKNGQQPTIKSLLNETIVFEFAKKLNCHDYMLKYFMLDDEEKINTYYCIQCNYWFNKSCRNVENN